MEPSLDSRTTETQRKQAIIDENWPNWLIKDYASNEWNY